MSNAKSGVEVSKPAVLLARVSQSWVERDASPRHRADAVQTLTSAGQDLLEDVVATPSVVAAAALLEVGEQVVRALLLPYVHAAGSRYRLRPHVVVECSSVTGRYERVPPVECCSGGDVADRA